MGVKRERMQSAQVVMEDCKHGVEGDGNAHCVTERAGGLPAWQAWSSKRAEREHHSWKGIVRSRSSWPMWSLAAATEMTGVRSERRQEPQERTGQVP